MMLKAVWDMETGDPDDFMTLLMLLDHPKVDLQAVTVTPGTPEQIGLVRRALEWFEKDIPVGAFKEACASLSTDKIRVKPIILDLQDKEGDNVFIDTMTSSTFMGDNNSAYYEMKRISEGLSSQGFKVIREKIETVPWHPAAPSKVDGNSAMPKDCYFETHFGVRTTDAHLSELREFAEETSIIPDNQEEDKPPKPVMRKVSEIVI